MSSVQLDGSHTRCRMGGEEVGYQARKSAKTTNILFLVDTQGIPLCLSKPIAGNHHDLYQINEHFKFMCQILEQAHIDPRGIVMNADADFDSTQYAYSNGRAALSGIRHSPPDVVLVDLNLPDVSGVECIQQLKDEFPHIQFLVISSSEDEELIFKALTAGAEGYLTKQTSPAQIIDLLEELVNGGAPMSSSIARQVIKFFNRPDGELAKSYENVLTKRELEVLTWLVQGSITYEEIGKKMYISKEAIKSHCSNIYRKLQVKSKEALIRKFYKNNPLVFRLETDNRSLKMDIVRLKQEVERLKGLG